MVPVAKCYWSRVGLILISTGQISQDFSSSYGNDIVVYDVRQDQG